VSSRNTSQNILEKCLFESFTCKISHWSLINFKFWIHTRSCLVNLTAVHVCLIITTTLLEGKIQLHLCSKKQLIIQKLIHCMKSRPH
jgi:hypothetical protein